MSGTLHFCTYAHTTRFYLCHHIRLSGGEEVLIAQRLLALCFGSPVNARHADGISPAKASPLSVYNNCCILLSSTRRSARSVPPHSTAEPKVSSTRRPLQLVRAIRKILRCERKEEEQAILNVSLAAELHPW